ncbi:two-component regulator propeller domain-containing protein [Tenacibaculum sp. 190130A14a]|uniref:Two component regulator with propeller domain n=1 Tax=Tenacibaculum polynesiense TaxID=3137857 RepID=A0ABM9PDA3_9FLAO
MNTHDLIHPKKVIFSSLICRYLWFCLMLILKRLHIYINVIVVLLFIISVSSSYGQNSVYKHFTSEDGLSHDITYQIIQDSKGYIWIGTDDGLVKYDGKEFRVFGTEKGLKSSFAIDIIEDVSNEEYLIATWGRGIHVLKNDSIVKKETRTTDYTKVNKIFKLNDTLVYGITNSSKQLFYNLKTGETITQYLGFDHQELLLKTKNNFTNVIQDINQEFIDGKLFIFDSELNSSSKTQLNGVYSYQNFKCQKEHFKEVNNKRIHALTKSNGYFVMSSYTTLFFYDGKRLVDQREINLKQGKIIQLQVDENNVYFVFINKENGLRELYCYDVKNDFLTNVSSKVLMKGSVSDFMFDKEGSLWVTTYGDGVYQILDIDNTFYDKNYFINPDLRDVGVCGGAIVTMAPNIIYTIHEENKIETQKIPFHTESFQILEDKRIDIIAPNRARGSYKEVTRDYTIKNKNCLEFSFKVGDKLVEVSGASFRIMYKEEVLKTEMFHPVEGAYVKTAVIYKDEVYVVFAHQGIYKLNVSTGELILWNEKLGIESSMFNDIIIDDKFLWVAANDGVYRVFEERIEHFTTKNGLLSNFVNDLFVDTHGVLWVGTQKGLNVFNKEKFYTIDKNLGQRSSSIKKITEYNSYLYAAGSKGLFKYDNLQAFTPVLNTNLKVFQKEAQFVISAINFTNPSTVRVQYKLNNDSWVETSAKEIDFKKLTQDAYQLVFRFKDGISDWSYTKPYKFKITAPWYKQLWFYVLLILGVASLIVVLVYTQLVRARKKNRVFQKILLERETLQKDLKNVRHQIARDFHDDLGNKLASISMLSNLSIKKTTKEHELYPNLNQIHKDANFLYAGMRDFVWSLDYNNNKLIEVQMYLNDFGEKLFEYANINFKSINNVAKSDVVLPHYWNKQLVLVFKEAMTNVLKHSKATEVLFTVFLKEDVLEITLKDDGVGFNLDNSGRKNGLQNMKERVKSINGDLSFKTENGCEVCFKGIISK